MSDSHTPPTQRRTQAERRAETRARLVQAARALFVEKGFAETGTPEVVRDAGVTRGALYHHFADKTDLFRAVAEQEAEAIAAAIEAQTADVTDPEQGMVIGTHAYFDAMAVPGRAKLLLLEAPSVLGYADAVALTKREGSESLKDGLHQAMPEMAEPDLVALTNVLSAAFDRAAAEIAEGSERGPYVNALFTLVGKALG